MVKTNQQKIVRCACYTRKSHEVDVDQNFNSLEAQREACENYIASQKSNGWICLPQHYDDGGYSGGNLNRPALERLKADIEAGQVDMIVIYKIDRLTRCLADLSDLQEFFDAHDVSFSSVTQEINTSTSAGRMMLNILMTFAQYEREIIADRVRDRVVAAKKKGMHCGGYPVLGYDVNPVTHKLEINEKEAEIVRFVFDKYNECGSAKEVAAELEIRGCRGKVWTTRKGVKHDGQHINNMIKLGNRQDCQQICKKLGYTEDDILKSSQIRVYQFNEEDKGKTEVQELMCGENGFCVPTFNDALDRIMDEAYEIQG